MTHQEDVSNSALVFGFEKLDAVQYEIEAVAKGKDIGFDGSVLRDVVGGCFVTDFGDWVEIAALSVNPGYRRLGIGNHLMRWVLKDWGRSHTICLMVEREHYPDSPMSVQQLVAWYERLGFEMGSPYHEGEGWMSRSKPFLY